MKLKSAYFLPARTVRVFINKRLLLVVITVLYFIKCARLNRTTEMAVK